MAHIGLISCVSKKQSYAAKAADIYVSSLFTKSRRFVEQSCDSWFILSAKYGLILPSEVIEPYEETLNKKSKIERVNWALKVWAKLRNYIKPGDRITILAGERYRENLLPLLQEYGCRIEIPLQGLGIGLQLQWLSLRLEKIHRERDVERLYRSLHKLESSLGGKRLMSKCRGSQQWPNSGVYIFFEPGESRTNISDPRIVRVGTHGVSRGSKTTLWNRLRTHRGTCEGLGNHRSSIFRLHVGSALSARTPTVKITSWGVGQTADAEIRKGEQDLERKVSAHIGAMSILWLAIEDLASPSSDRAFIERNLIGLLVGNTGPSDPPSKKWLGRFSHHDRIRFSGLWNLDFLDYPSSPDFLDIFEEYVRITAGELPQPSNPIAPRTWYLKEKLGITYKQRSLFEE